MAQLRAPVLRGGHVHRCPSCNEVEACDDACSCDFDMMLNNKTPCGSYVKCNACRAVLTGEAEKEST